MGPHVTGQLSAYMDGELAADERAQVDAHLRACPPCSTHLAELRALEAAARALPLEVPDGYFEAFPGRVRQRLAGRRQRRQLVVPMWIGAAAAAVVLALITPRLLRDPMPPPEPAAARVLGKPEPLPPAAPPAAKSESREADSPAKPDLRDALRQRLEERATERAQPRTTPAPPEAPALLRRQDPGSTPSAAGEGYAAPPEDVDRVQSAPAQSLPAGTMPAESAPRTKRMEAEARNNTTAQAEEAKARRDGTALGGLQDRAAAPSANETRYRALLGKTASSAAEARALRDAWRAYLRDEPAGTRADEARVRAIEAGAAAWRAGGDAKDRAEAEREGREYLARTDARQSDRVRAALQALSR